MRNDDDDEGLGMVAVVFLIIACAIAAIIYFAVRGDERAVNCDKPTFASPTLTRCE